MRLECIPVYKCALEIILEITLKIVLKKVFQSIIGNQRDCNEIMFDDVEVGGSENQILGSSTTNNR